MIATLYGVSGYPRQETHYLGSSTSGTAVETLLTEWTGFSNIVQVPMRVTTTWNQTGQVSKVETDYDSFSADGGTVSLGSPVEI